VPVLGPVRVKLFDDQSELVKYNLEAERVIAVLELEIEIVTSDVGAAPIDTESWVWSSSAKFIAVGTMTEYS
jgi:hypothetical protein